MIPINGDVNEGCVSEGDKERKVKRLEVDRAELEKILDEAVDLTSSQTSLDTLIDLYSALARVVQSYSKNWDRTNLPQVLK